MSLMRPRPVWVVLVLLGLLLVAALLGDNGALRLWRLRAEVTTLHHDVQALEAENERLTRAITDLRDDPVVLERLAREELGLVRPGERVLRFPRSARPDGPRGGVSTDAPRTP